LFDGDDEEADTSFVLVSLLLSLLFDLGFLDSGFFSNTRSLFGCDDDAEGEEVFVLVEVLLPVAVDVVTLEPLGIRRRGN
jgi:hypothetical protein